MQKSEKTVIVCGYPKSGTTWATRLVAELLDCPAKGYWGFEGKTFVEEGKERLSDFVCYQSHHLHQELVEELNNHWFRIIYIVRDPRDVATSGIFHFDFYREWIDYISDKRLLPRIIMKPIRKLDKLTQSKRYRIRRMIDLMVKGKEPLAPWTDHVHSFLSGQKILRVSYEDLLNNGVDTVKDILNFLEVSRSQNEINKALDVQSFAVKKKEVSVEPDVARFKHLRKGISGDWVNHLSKEDEAFIRKTMIKPLSDQLNYQ